MNEAVKEALEFARNHPFEFIMEGVVTFGILFGGTALVALAG